MEAAAPSGLRDKPLLTVGLAKFNSAGATVARIETGEGVNRTYSCCTILRTKPRVWGWPALFKPQTE